MFLFCKIIYRVKLNSRGIFIIIKFIETILRPYIFHKTKCNHTVKIKFSNFFFLLFSLLPQSIIKSFFKCASSNVLHSKQKMQLKVWTREYINVKPHFTLSTLL